MSTSANNQSLDRASSSQSSNPTETAKKNYTAVKYGNDKGTLRFGHIHKKGDVTAGVMLDTPDGRHQFSLDIDGQRKGWTTSTSPGNFQVLAGEDNTEPDDTLILNAVNGNICITAHNGKIRLQGTDIELVAIGEGGEKGHIKCTATETFTVHETKKIIFLVSCIVKVSVAVHLMCPLAPPSPTAINSISVACNLILPLVAHISILPLTAFIKIVS